MGGNGAYSTITGSIPAFARTHTDTELRVEGHKVLVQTKNPMQSKVPMNSNSENPIYLCGKVDKRTEALQISKIGIYEKHKLTRVIDLSLNNDGTVVPFSKESPKTSHLHNLSINEEGIVGRKAHDKSNIHPIPSEYLSLIEKISEFNKLGKIWKE